MKEDVASQEIAIDYQLKYYGMNIQSGVRNEWRKNYNNILKFIVGPPKVYHEDPFTVVLVEFKIGDTEVTIPGFTKRCRYGSDTDKPSYSFAVRVGTERAMKIFFLEFRDIIIKESLDYSDEPLLTVEVIKSNTKQTKTPKLD